MIVRYAKCKRYEDFRNPQGSRLTLDAIEQIVKDGYKLEPLLIKYGYIPAPVVK